MIYERKPLNDYDGAGVYAIVNRRSGKEYIGSSKNIRKRIERHMYQLKVGKHYNKDLQSDYAAGDKFDFILLHRMYIGRKRELEKEERRCLNSAIRTKKSVYNKAPVSSTGYVSKEKLIFTFADQYCRKKFGVALNTFLNSSEARYTMEYEIIMNPNDEESIREEFEPIIKYQNMSRYVWSQYHMSYEDYMDLSETEKKNLYIKRGGK